jgi:hypothetical protein
MLSGGYDWHSSCELTSVIWQSAGIKFLLFARDEGGLPRDFSNWRFSHGAREE